MVAPIDPNRNLLKGPNFRQSVKLLPYEDIEQGGKQTTGEIYCIARANLKSLQATDREEKLFEKLVVYHLKNKIDPQKAIKSFIELLKIYDAGLV